MDYVKKFKNALSSQPNCILGKNGITNEFVNHVNKLLKRYKVIKIKALRSVATKSNVKELANKISNLTNSYLIDVRGKIFILSLHDFNKFN
ncbi:MAG: RNA-binding protein [Promethearchaeota archaeon Loki_b32]|nr:MAG: RNA-binding protein [Candidatus Lokiarchaeota archaeon Loki_b32]